MCFRVYLVEEVEKWEDIRDLVSVWEKLIKLFAESMLKYTFTLKIFEKVKKIRKK